MVRMQLHKPTGESLRLMNAKQVAFEIFDDHVSAEWVRRNVPMKITLGHSTVMWYEKDVREWVKSRQEGRS